MHTARWKPALAFVAASVVTVILLFPVYWMVMTAIMPTSEILSRDPSLVPRLDQVSFEAFGQVFERRPFLAWMLNSLYISAIATSLSMIASTFAGYSLSRYRFMAHQLTGAGLLISKLVPSSLIIIPIFILFTTLGMTDSYFGLVLAHMAVGVPLATWFMKGFFDRIPRELEQAAMIDGCSPMGALRHVVLPLARPGLAAVGIYLLIISWSEFIFARTLILSDGKTVLTVGLQSFVGEYNVDWATLMAAGTISLIPVIILFLILEPFLVSCMTKGALAGS
jgi:multiple sugar transport system permease protein